MCVHTCVYVFIYVKNLTLAAGIQNRKQDGEKLWVGTGNSVLVGSKF